MTAPVCFLDIETTGLHPDRHEPWEVALIVPDRSGSPGVEYVWQFPINEADADPFALDIGGYWQRRWPASAASAAEADLLDPPAYRGRGVTKAVAPTREWCVAFRDLVGTRHLVGAVPSFDEERLRRLLERNGVLHRWHYHLIDVEGLAAGWLAGRGQTLDEHGWNDHPDDVEAISAASDAVPPWDSEDLSRAVGVDPDQFDRHTALGDARWAKAIYERILG